jgi:uncharacterized 2Fe-2S/4Fe-4S cluster protein (DUF4445 family)
VIGPREPLIIFTPSGRRGRFPTGTLVLDAARSLGVDIDSVCGGRGICGRCQVEQSVGAFPKHGITSSPEHLSEPGELELAYAVRRGLGEGRRLSCATSVAGDAVIDIPAASQVHRQVVRKELEVRPFDLDPVVRLHYVEVAPPDLASPASDHVRLLDALEREWGLGGLEVDLAVVRALQPALRDGDRGVTVAVRDARTVVAVWPGFRDRAYGVAVDVGSTTIAGHLASLLDGSVLASAGIMNPQIRFGEDLMSRVSWAMLHADGAAEMTRAVRASLRSLVEELTTAAGVGTDEILEIVLVGNPVMHHLFLGLDPTPLGQAPFTLATERAVRTTPAALDLEAHPGAAVYVLPCIAGHVGADTAGVILAEQPHRGDPIRLIVDVGTNAEIVLGNRDRLLAASSPTGPAFEGAQISAGQRAAPGAIERVRVDPGTLEPRFKVIGCGLWSDEPGFAEATGEIGITGICGSGIVEVIAELFLAGVITADGIVDGRMMERTGRVVPDGRTFAYVLSDGSPRILVTQADVRAIQLAKAALYAGARLLMDAYGVDAVDEVRLAGAFGSHIDVRHAMILGLVPDCDLDRVGSAGNAAGAGALIALLSRGARAEVEEVVRRVGKIETAIEPRFQEHFVDALAIPHRSAPYPNLSRIVDLPARPAGGRAAPDDRSERRRRRQPVAAREEDR